MRKSTTKKTKEKKESGVCIDCQFAYLMQGSKNDPIVSLCEKNHGRQVARMFQCHSGEFHRREGEIEIHPMIPAKLY